MEASVQWILRSPPSEGTERAARTGKPRIDTCLLRGVCTRIFGVYRAFSQVATLLDSIHAWWIAWWILTRIWLVFDSFTRSIDSKCALGLYRQDRLGDPRLVRLQIVQSRARFAIIRITRQQEFHASGEEWEGFEQQAHEAHQYSVFLYNR